MHLAPINIRNIHIWCSVSFAGTRSHTLFRKTSAKTMFSDVFNKKQAENLLSARKIWFVGSSNMRSIYKDFLWLLTHESLAAEVSFKVKNEESFLNDKKLSNDSLHNGRNYKEIREFRRGDIHLYFHFITRLYLDHFIELINGINSESAPDVIFLNSCLWDLSRWGPDGTKTFKENLLKTFKFLKSKLPAKTKLVWKTSLPVSTSASAAIFIDEIKNIVPMLPWHLLEANNYAATCANFFNFDTIDVHHYLRLQGHFRVKDGIHWCPLAIRYITNVFLTHLALAWHVELPGVYQPTVKFLTDTDKMLINEDTLTARVNKKEGFFKKLFERTENVKRSLTNGIKNKFLTVSKTITRQNSVRDVQRKLKNIAHHWHRHQDPNFNRNYVQNPYANYRW